MEAAAAGLVALGAEAPPTGLNPFPDSAVCSMSQVLFLAAVYGYVLFQASNLISDGAELLLLVPRFAPVVGSIVLPVLGAVPDGMMVLFSGLGPDAQTQVSVGVGALAGSTIMLLTLPWFLAVTAGRVNMKGGIPSYRKPMGADPDSWAKLMPANNFSLLGTGVGYGPEICTNAKMMLFTLIGYVIIQAPAFRLDQMPKPAGITPEEMKEDVTKESAGENSYALAGLIICCLEFVYYLWKMATDDSGTEKQDDQIVEANVQAMKDGTLTLRGAMASFQSRNWSTLCESGDLEKVLIKKESMDEVRRMCKVLAPFFAQYDANGDNQIDFEEFRLIFRDVNENLSRAGQAAMFDAADTDKSGNISFEEFVACFMSFALDPSNDIKQEKVRTKANPKKYIDGDKAESADDEEEDTHEEEEEDMPADLADLQPEDQQRRIKQRAFGKLVAGTALVLVFSDPTVDVLNEVGVRMGISPFYVSFVLAPLASNATELVAAYNYAKKRTVKSMTTSLSSLLGAAVMNNTFCLGIFLALVYFRGLAWEFSAETISIMTIQVMVALSVLFRNTQRLLDAFFILAFYPVAMLIVWVLENKLGFD
mmetsp:Transcript_3040/g.6481  ORF Transcript_3040/g.6481 Transcript_3040/m.6481 type:complete len:593 (+) Transcript_3040:96-1874(+)